MRKRSVFVSVAVWCVLLAGAMSAFAQAPPETRDAGPSRLVRGLSVSYSVLQGLDVYTTRVAIARGAVEANPLMRGVVGNTAALTAVKGGLTFATVWLLDRASRKHRGIAIAEAVAMNALSAVVVVHNFSVLRQLR